MTSVQIEANGSISVDFDAEELDALAAHLDRFPDVSGVPLDRQDLERDLEALRSNGFHVSVGERAAGVMALSVPVRTTAGELLGALSLAGPAEGQSVEELRGRAGEVTRTAFAIGESFSRGL